MFDYINITECPKLDGVEEELRNLRHLKEQEIKDKTIEISNSNDNYYIFQVANKFLKDHKSKTIVTIETKQRVFELNYTKNFYSKIIKISELEQLFTKNVDKKVAILAIEKEINRKKRNSIDEMNEAAQSKLLFYLNLDLSYANKLKNEYSVSIPISYNYDIIKDYYTFIVTEYSLILTNVKKLEKYENNTIYH